MKDNQQKKKQKTRYPSQIRSTMTVERRIAEAVKKRSAERGINQEMYVGMILKGMLDDSIDLSPKDEMTKINFMLKDAEGVKDAMKQKGYKTVTEAFVKVIENNLDDQLFDNDK